MNHQLQRKDRRSPFVFMNVAFKSIMEWFQLAHTAYTSYRSYIDYIPIRFDLLCYLLGLILAIPIGFVHSTINYRHVYYRHIYSIFFGVIFSFAIFGYTTVHVIFISTFMFLKFKLFNSSNNNRNNTMNHLFDWIFCMGYLLILHIYRMYYDYLGYTLDINAVLMLTVMKLTMLSYNYNINITLLEFYSYIFYYGNYLAGPVVRFNDYIEFIDGRMFIDKNDSKISSVKPTLIVFFQSALFAIPFAIHMFWFNMDTIRTPYFDSLNYKQKLAFAFISAYTVRYRYYFGWKLCECANIASKLAYNSRNNDKTNSSDNINWDRTKSFEWTTLELHAFGCKDMTTNWNIPVSVLWLKNYVYKNIIFSKTKSETDQTDTSYFVKKRWYHSHFVAAMSTHFVSSIWHGLYPGYFLCYITFGFALMIERIATITFGDLNTLFIHKSPRLQSLFNFSRWVYMQILWMYGWLGFMLLDLESIYKVWGSLLYFSGHIFLMFLFIFVSTINIYNHFKKIDLKLDHEK